MSNPRLIFTAIDKEWINKKWRAIREAQQAADKANNDWKDLSSALKKYLDDSGIDDPVQRAKIVGENLALADALATGNWHSRNAERHIHDVNLFLRLRELGLK